MAIWKLETAPDFTAFEFVSEADKIFFHTLVTDYMEDAKPVSRLWRTLFMLRSEPMLHPDFFEIDQTDIIAISQRAVDKLKEALLSCPIELLPIETDAGLYYAMNIMHFVDGLDKTNSVFVATRNGLIVSYSMLEFDEEKIKNHSIFKITELPYEVFIADEFLEIYEEEELAGLLFDAESNLVWYA